MPRFGAVHLAVGGTFSKVPLFASLPELKWVSSVLTDESAETSPPGLRATSPSGRISIGSRLAAITRFEPAPRGSEASDSTCRIQAGAPQVWLAVGRIASMCWTSSTGRAKAGRWPLSSAEAATPSR